MPFEKILTAIFCSTFCMMIWLMKSVIIPELNVPWLMKLLWYFIAFQVVFNWISINLRSKFGKKLACQTKPETVRNCVRCLAQMDESTQHCTMCRKCVDGFFYHSYLLGKCVGDKNRKQSIIFLLYLFIFMFIYAVFMVFYFIYINPIFSVVGFTRLVPIITLIGWLLGYSYFSHFILTAFTYISVTFTMYIYLLIIWHADHLKSNRPIHKSNLNYLFNNFASIEPYKIESDTKTSTSKESYQKFQQSTSELWKEDYVIIPQISEDFTPSKLKKPHFNKLFSRIENDYAGSQYSKIKSEININENTLSKDLPNTVSLTEPIHKTSKLMPDILKKPYLIRKYDDILHSEEIDIDALRKLCWFGIERKYRPMCWKLLTGYVSTSHSEKAYQTCSDKKDEYKLIIKKADTLKDDTVQRAFYHQIKIDIPRMDPEVAHLQQEVMFNRMLFAFACQYKPIGYVQGMNDLMIPFFITFLDAYVNPNVSNENLDSLDVSKLSKSKRDQLETDCYWCFEYLITSIKNNFIKGHPSILKKLEYIHDVINFVDPELNTHLEALNIDYLLFGFRWFNNLLIRELPVHTVIRIWDTCLCEDRGFDVYFTYVCVAFLLYFAERVKQFDNFQCTMVFLQNLPTKNITSDQIDTLLAKAYELKSQFFNSRIFQNDPFDR
ncbi:TBC1 domain family member 22A [Intoshia linei]|uniref:Palmitoyltransferase n=1 Tax=Intoshia linei TaxID=1819745 RepID=A0A177B2F3_9BILA|nr:TBC1 domain family member 22A [Intoshia linei]